MSFLKHAETATKLLAKVMDEHAGTPFARLARLELERGFGWSWREEHIEYPWPYHPTHVYEWENRWNPKVARKQRLPRRVPKL